MATPCPHCACASAAGGNAHAVLAMLAADDLDAALELGLLAAQPCPGCETGCHVRLVAARDARHCALAARDRHRARARRLLRRKAEREAARAPLPSPATRAPALPPSAADALARALAKASGRDTR
jgi:hypothetical protein